MDDDRRRCRHHRHDLPLDGQGDQREPEWHVQEVGGQVLPLGHDRLHLFRGRVLRCLLRRAVLYASDLGAGDRRL